MNYEQQTMHDVRYTMDNELLTKEHEIEQWTLNYEQRTKEDESKGIVVSV